MPVRPIVAEMAGIVNRVHVTEGDRVATGQELVTLESMKMLIPVPAPGPGRVAAVKVSPGEFVNEGDELVVLEEG